MNKTSEFQGQKEHPCPYSFSIALSLSLNLFKLFKQICQPGKFLTKSKSVKKTKTVSLTVTNVMIKSGQEFYFIVLSTQRTSPGTQCASHSLPKFSVYSVFCLVYKSCKVICETSVLKIIIPFSFCC